MSAPQFTPGPWWTELDKVFVGTPPNYTLVADADPDNRGGHDGAEPMLANARLIAAAPTMHERLAVLVEALGRFPGTKNNDELWGAYTGAVAVLAQARGGPQ